MEPPKKRKTESTVGSLADPGPSGSVYALAHVNALAELSHLFECPVCLDPFQDPRILPLCGHHMCRGCLEDLASRGVRMYPQGAIQCPVCRAVSIIKPGLWVSDFLKPYILNRIQAKVVSGAGSAHSTACCDPCGPTQAQAAFYCDQCREKLCEDCEKTHSQCAVFTYHQASRIENVTFCELHAPEKFVLSILCHTCDEVICRRCVFSAHIGHHTESILKITTGLREKAEEVKITLSNNMKRIQESLDLVKKKKPEVLSCVENITQIEVNTNLIKKLEGNLITLKAKVELRHRQKQEPWENLTLKLEKDKESTQSQLQETESRLALKDADLVRKRKVAMETDDWVVPVLPEVRPDPNPSVQQLVQAHRVLQQLRAGFETGDWRGKGTIRFKITQLQKMAEDFVESEYVYIRGLLWTLKAKPSYQVRNYIPIAKKAKYLSVYVQCKGDDKVRDWSCKAYISLKILCCASRGINYAYHNMNETFSPERNSLGYPMLILWADLVNPNAQLVRDDTTTIEATVLAELPRVGLGL